jgi:hypothetical protein
MKTALLLVVGLVIALFLIAQLIGAVIRWASRDDWR